jgi:hypothetical protein
MIARSGPRTVPPKYPEKLLPDNRSEPIWGDASETALYRGSGRLFRPRPGRLERTWGNNWPSGFLFVFRDDAIIGMRKMSYVANCLNAQRSRRTKTYNCGLMDRGLKARKSGATFHGILCRGVHQERRCEVEYPYWAITRVNPPSLVSPSKQRWCVVPQTPAQSTSLLATECQSVRSYLVHWLKQMVQGNGRA